MKAKHPIHEYNGFWWIPQDPKNQYFGNLKIDETGEIHLKLFGNSRENRDEYLDLDHNILYGICENNTNITVFGLYHYKGIASNFFTSSLEYRYCIVGYHASIEDDINFQEINVGLSELAGWFAEYETRRLKNPKDRYFEKKELYSDNIRKISFCALNVEFSNFQTRRVEIQRKEHFKIEYSEPRKYYEVFEELKLISMLMSILGRCSIQIQEIFVPYSVSGMSRQANFFINNQTYFTTQVDRSFRRKQGHKFIGYSLRNIFEYVFQMDETDKFVLEVLSNTYLRNPGDTRVDFFNIVSAYESWHRANVAEIDSKKSKMYESILEIVKNNKELKEWIGSNSTVLKGVSLGSRIEYLMEQDQWMLISDKSKFKTIVTTTRNMIAHNLKESRNVANFGELIIIQSIMQIILEILFLKALKLPTGFIDEHTHNHPIIEKIIFMIDANRHQIRF